MRVTGKGARGADGGVAAGRRAGARTRHPAVVDLAPDRHYLVGATPENKFATVFWAACAPVGSSVRVGWTQSGGAGVGRQGRPPAASNGPPFGLFAVPTTRTTSQMVPGDLLHLYRRLLRGAGHPGRRGLRGRAHDQVDGGDAHGAFCRLAEGCSRRSPDAPVAPLHSRTLLMVRRQLGEAARVTAITAPSRRRSHAIGDPSSSSTPLPDSGAFSCPLTIVGWPYNAPPSTSYLRPT
jgi:hypothetical protein